MDGVLLAIAGVFFCIGILIFILSMCHAAAIGDQVIEEEERKRFGKDVLLWLDLQESESNPKVTVDN